jgi:hypothetical protein
MVESGLWNGEDVSRKRGIKIDSPPRLGHALDDDLQLDQKRAVGTNPLPIMGHPIDKTSIPNTRAKKVYFCCPGCIDDSTKTRKNTTPTASV